jgi:serine/threonine-protein kinase HipA
MNKCLYCYEPLSAEEKAGDYHPRCSEAFFGRSNPPQVPYTLDQMGELARQVVERSVAVPGVQPKLSMSVINEAKANTGDRLTVVGAMGGNYIFKPPSGTYPEMPQNEHLTMRIAQAYGIRVVDSSLVRLASGELAYITKRIDRTKEGGKVHMLDMFQITEAFDKYRSSLEKVGKALHAYSANTLLDKLFFFELCLFSFLTGNNDMHLKNFSMIETTAAGRRHAGLPPHWELSPAYDLLNVTIVLPEDKEELALTLGGEKRKLEKADLDYLADTLGLTSKQADGAFNRMSRGKSEAEQWIAKSFLSKDMKEAYQQVMVQRYVQLGI